MGGLAVTERVPLAQDARPFKIEPMDAKYKGSVRRGEEVYARRMLDTTLHDRMRDVSQLSDDQHATAEWLYRLRAAAKVTQRITARLDTVAEDHHDDDVCTDQVDPDEAYQRYRAVMKSLPDHQSAKIESLLCGQHPGVRWLATVQAGLDLLKNAWGR